MGRRVLILEDDEILLKQLGRLLAGRGYEVHGAASVAAFLKTAAAEPFDACLIDVSLPDGDGLDAWAAAREGQPDAVAAVMTAHGTPEVERRAADLGVRALLPKPLDVPALLAALEPVAG